MNEHELQASIVAVANELGFPNVAAIRNVRFSPESGRADVVLLPKEGLHRIVLIEAKLSDADDAQDKVIGQLLKYYSQALRLGVEGVELMRSYACGDREAACSNEITTPSKIAGGVSLETAWAELQKGRPLRPEEIALFVAFNGELSPILRQTITALDVHHDLRIGAIRVAGGKASVLAGADLTQRWP